MYSDATAVSTSGLAMKASRWLEVLGAAGCAAFFVSFCALSIETLSEIRRTRETPSVRVRWVSPRALADGTWALQRSQEPVPQPALAAASASASRTPRTPGPRSDRIVVRQAQAQRQALRDRAEAQMVLSLTRRLVAYKRAHLAQPAVVRTSTRLMQLAKVTKQPRPQQRASKRVSIHRAEAGAPRSPVLASQQTQGPSPQEAAPSSPDRVPAGTATAAAAAALPVAPHLPAEPAVSSQPPEPSADPVALQGTVSADTQLQFSFRPTEVRLKDTQGNQWSVVPEADGRILVPPSRTGAGEYSFEVRSPHRGPAIAAVVGGSQPQALAAWSPDRRDPSSLDLRLERIPERNVAGVVFEADAAEPVPIEGIEVSLVGDSTRVAITDATGAFDLGKVGVPEGAELFLEAKRPGGFTHRFRASLGSEQRLFLLSENQIQEWTRSFEGGLSPRSGWLLGAATAAGKLRPMVHPQGGTSRLEPETYVLGAANELVPASEAEPTVGAKRWLSVELPEGEARVGLVDGAGRWERETWAPISPGVITVILFGAAE